MASSQEYRDARARVEAGTGSDRDFELTRNMADNAGIEGSASREALRKAGRGTN